MLKKLSLIIGCCLLLGSLGFIVAEQIAIDHLKKELKTYAQGDVTITGAQLYLDGLSVDRIEISDQFIFKNVLFGANVIKHIETLEINFVKGQGALQTELPMALYDKMNIKFITLNFPFFDDTVAVKGRLQAQQQSDGSTGYIFNFNTQDDEIRTKGMAKISINNQKIDDIAIELETADTRYNWLNAKRITGWWDYKGKTNEQSGELSIGSLEWNDLVLNNVQLNYLNNKWTMAGDLPGGSGQVDGDLTWQDGKPVLSLASNITDLSAYDETMIGIADFQTTLTLEKWDIQKADFFGVGNVKGRFDSKVNMIDFDYIGQLTKQGKVITVKSDDCLNAMVSIKRQDVRLSIPNKTCFTHEAPIVFENKALQSPLSLKAKNVEYRYQGKMFKKPSTGMIKNFLGRIRHFNDVDLTIKNVSSNHQNIKNLNADIHIGSKVFIKNNTMDVALKGKMYQINTIDNITTINDKKTGQKIAELMGRIHNGQFTGEATYNGPLNLFDDDVSNGQALYNGSVGFSINDPLSKMDGVGVLKITSADIKKGDLTAQDLTAQLKTKSLKPLTIENNQRVEIKKGKLGVIDFENGVFYVDKSLEDSATINTVQLNAMDTVWKGEGGLLKSDIIRLNQVIKKSSFDGLVMEPNEMVGQMNIGIKDGMPLFGKGIFKSLGSGVVTYDLAKRPDFLNAGSDYYDLQRMRDILQNFNMEELAVPFDENGMRGLYLRGSHLNFNDGKPIELDLTVSNVD